MSDIEKRIDKLERTINELRNELRTLRVLVRTDYPSALNKIRFITEKILSQLCKEHAISWGSAEPTLENMIGPLVAKQIIPRPIAIHVRSVQANSSPGSHFQETPLSAAHLEIAQMALVEFLEWYYSTHSSPDPVHLPVPHESIPQKTTNPPAAQNTTPPPAPLPAKTVLIAISVVACLAILAGLVGLIYYLHLPKKHEDKIAATAPATLPSPEPVKPPDDAAVQNANVLLQNAMNSRNKPVMDLCDSYESRIKNYCSSNNFLPAINIVGDYQLALLHRDPAPTFTNGLFQADSHGISCMIPTLTDWKAQDVNSKDSYTNSLQSAGVDTLLDLQGTNPRDNLWFISNDLTSVSSRMGEAQKDSDQSTSFLVNQFFSAFGTVTTSEFQQVGTLRILYFQLSTTDSDEEIIGAAFEHNGLWFGILSSSATQNHADNVARLDSILHAITFNDDPTMATAIEQIKKQITRGDDISQILTAVRQIALLGQFRRASQELAVLTSVIAASLPAPVIDNNVADDSTYGIKFKNPDPKNLELINKKMGVTSFLMLQPRNSDALNFIGVGVLNPTLIYGPKAYELIGPGSSNDDIKAYLRGCGRGAILNGGGTIESESYDPFRGLLAFNIVGTLAPAHSKDSDIREKVIVVIQPNYCLVMIIMLGTKDQITLQQAALDQLLEIRTDKPPTTKP